MLRCVGRLVALNGYNRPGLTTSARGEADMTALRLARGAPTPIRAEEVIVLLKLAT
jgi:hypothetical protein